VFGRKGWKSVWIQIGPSSGNQRTAAIREDQRQVQEALAMSPAEKLQSLTMQGMVIA